MDHFDEFAKQWVPRWPAHEALILDAYEQLVRRIGACTIVAHSQGAGFAAEIARRLPTTVRQVVAIEPGGMPAERVSLGSPHLVMWGDHIEASGSHWINYRRQADAYCESIARHASVTTLDLPSEGIAGNSHFLMMDANSDDVFARVTAWLESRH